jgi:nucleoside-diphosphate-sugar epimerase
MKPKNILILGGSGNIGKHIISSLNDDNIFILDRVLPKKNNLNNLKYIKCDLLKNQSLKKIPKKIDVVLFLIGHVGGPESLDIKNLKKYLDYNCETLNNFFKLTKNKKIKKLIFISTEHVYGDNAKKTSKTTTIEPNPKNYYGVSKLFSEKILYKFYKENSICIDILRIPRVVFDKVDNPISSMLINAIEKKRIILNNTKAKFNFIYFEDLIRSLLICFNQKKTGFRILNIFNNSKPMSLYLIAKLIKNKINNNFKIFYLKKKYNNEHNPLNLIVSNKETKKILKWKPLFDNNKIVTKLIKIYEIKKNFR